MTLTQREAFARTMEHLCNHDSHGYTQGNRWGNGTKETVDLGDGVTVEVMQGDRDCSSAIISALDAVGVDTGDATYTGNMRRNILNSGLFVWKGEEFVAGRGDIYLNEACHTAMSLDEESTRLAEFAISENGTAYGNEGDQTGSESRFVDYYNYPWDGILHWKNDGATLGAPPRHEVHRVDNGIYRLYNPYNGQHMFTASYDEAQYLCDIGWNDEGVDWKQGNGGRVYRLYNANNGDHFFTTSLIEVVECVMRGWKLEGIGFKEGSTTEIYRLFNPNNGEHFYTSSEAEFRNLTKVGWTDEGVGFMGD